MTVSPSALFSNQFVIRIVNQYGIYEYVLTHLYVLNEHSVTLTMCDT